MQIKSVDSQDEHCLVENVWKGRHIDYVIYFAQRSNWGYVWAAFKTSQKHLDDPSHKRFQQINKSLPTAFHTC